MVDKQAKGAAGALGGLSDSLAEAVERAGAAVVRVDARRRQSASGVVWAADGLILTADHVLERDEDLTLGLPDRETVEARIVGRDQGTDLALLRAELGSLAPIEKAPEPKVGHLALLVARPNGGLSTSLGVVTALGGPARTRRGGQLDSFIRTDAIFYPGFSGGPLVDTAGRMLGLATSHFGPGNGLAISLQTVERVAASLLSHGRVRRGFLGLSSQTVELPEALRKKLDLDQQGGLLAVGVEPGGPAERGGLMLGDLLVTLGDQPIRDTDDLQIALGPDSVGQARSARVIRGGELRELSITIGERD